MPELPEVEMFRRSLGSLVGQRFQSVDIMDEGVVLGECRTLLDGLEGRRLIGLERHGKHLFMLMDGDLDIVVHFGMSGSPHVGEEDDKVPFTRVRMRTDSGLSLSMSWVRKLGWIGAVGSMGAYIRERGLGPDALRVDVEEFLVRLMSGRMAVKAKLLDQRVVAGLGNLYVDEILFQTRIDPHRGVDEIDRAEGCCLYQAMRGVLKTSLAAGTDFSRLGNGYLLMVRDAKGSCPRCDSALYRSTVGGRTTFHCPRCQL